MANFTQSTAGVATIALSDDADGTPIPVVWAGALVALGARLARYVATLKESQLVVILTVPQREFVTGLIGAGWTLTRNPRPVPADALAYLKSLKMGTICRIVTRSHVYMGALGKIDESRRIPTVSIGGTSLHVDAVIHACEADESVESRVQVVPKSGSLARFADAEESWSRRLVSPAQDLAIVGTATRLIEEMNAVVSVQNDADGETLRDLLLPKEKHSATWFCEILSSSRAEFIPDDFAAVFLDGQGALRFIDEVFAQVVVCVVDRSISDETQLENLINFSATGAPVSLAETLNWVGPVGVEAFAFEVQL